MSDKTDKTQTIITNMNRTDTSIVPRLCENRQRKILTIRSFSGLSGDMLCCGLGYAWLEEQNLQPSSAEGDKAINDMAGAIMPFWPEPSASSANWSTASGAVICAWICLMPTDTARLATSTI